MPENEAMKPLVAKLRARVVEDGIWRISDPDTERTSAFGKAVTESRMVAPDITTLLSGTRHGKEVLRLTSMAKIFVEENKEK